MRVFFNAIVIQILLNAYIYWRGRQALPNRKFIQIPFALVFIFELLVYFVGYFGSHRLPFEYLHDLTWIGTSWMIFIIYTGSLLLIYDLFRFINKKKKIFPRSVDLQNKKLRLSYFCMSLLVVLSSMAYGNYKFRHPVVKELNLTIDKYSPEVKKLKIVVAADIHVGYLIDRDILKMYVDKIMEQKPDMILLVGDIIDYDLKSVREQKMEEEFKRLSAPFGVFASTGNHEYIQLAEEEENEKIKWLRDESGLTLLQDTAVFIADSFYVVGREDDKCLTRKPLSQIMQRVDRQYPIIVINHEPHRLQEEVAAGADIALYGHTHDGQVFPNNFLVKRLYELSYGYKKKDNTHIYVTSGLGLAGPQYRIGTVSEIMVLNVKFDK
ncbi:metallophosphoesterase [Dysgonomonas sp. ZJ279]|uniref:metallophosphoesterase n=1 Tax=Dysgonomonas sp. ZJ279 TaxID=2709796 RepID=UPI0013EC6D78|nr:metallophosphoesterase [Dysgonomonas sp. ZJ279]